MAHLVLDASMFCNLKLDTKMHVFHIPLFPSEYSGSSNSAPVCRVRAMTSQQVASQSTATAHQMDSQIFYYTWSYSTQIVNAQSFDSLKLLVPTP